MGECAHLHRLQSVGEDDFLVVEAFFSRVWTRVAARGERDAVTGGVEWGVTKSATRRASSHESHLFHKGRFARFACRGGW